VRKDHARSDLLIRLPRVDPEFNRNLDRLVEVSPLRLLDKPDCFVNRVANLGINGIVYFLILFPFLGQ
jgi:hypothetical protein